MFELAGQWLLPVALGKFGLVSSQAIFSRLETRQSGPRQKFWDRDRDHQGPSRSVWSRSRPGPDSPWRYIYSRVRQHGERELWGWAGGEVVGRCGPACLDAVGCGRSLAIIAVETMDVELAVGDVCNVIILEVEHMLGMLDPSGSIGSNKKLNQLWDAVLRHECMRLGVHQLGTGGPCGGSHHSTGWRTSDR